MHPQCAPLAWMIGSWAGAGVVGYPSIESRNFGQEVDVTHDGRPFLMWTSRAWILDEQGNKVRPAAIETGFWRPQPDGKEVELLLAHQPPHAVELRVVARPLHRADPIPSDSPLLRRGGSPDG